MPLHSIAEQHDPPARPPPGLCANVVGKRWDTEPTRENECNRWMEMVQWYRAMDQLHISQAIADIEAGLIGERIIDFQNWPRSDMETCLLPPWTSYHYTPPPVELS